MAESWLGPFPSPFLTLNLAQFPSSARSHSMSTLRSQNPNPSCSSIPNLTPAAQPSLLVFSGGTAFNGVVEDLKTFTTRVAHVLPVSDDGGSTAEIVRVLGGPAVGDIRSRCLRLADKSTSEAVAVRQLLGHRLPLDARQAKSVWYDIVEGEHNLWTGVSKPYRETIELFWFIFRIRFSVDLMTRFASVMAALGISSLQEHVYFFGLWMLQYLCFLECQISHQKVWFFQ